MPGIRVFWVERSTGRTSEAAHPDVYGLLARDDGWLWLGIPDPDEQTAEQLTSSFGFHARAVHGRDGTGARAAHARLRGPRRARPAPPAARRRRPRPRPRAGPLRGAHLPRHRPRAPQPRRPPLEAMLTETEKVARRPAAGRVTPPWPVAPAGWIVATLTLRRGGVGQPDRREGRRSGEERHGPHGRQQPAPTRSGSSSSWSSWSSWPRCGACCCSGRSARAGGEPDPTPPPSGRARRTRVSAARRTRRPRGCAVRGPAPSPTVP